MYEIERKKCFCLEIELDSFRKQSEENDDIYYKMQNWCGELCDREIQEDLSEKERYCYELLMDISELQEKADDLYSQIMTKENKNRIVMIMEVEERHSNYEYFTVAEKEYYESYIERVLYRKQKEQEKAQADLKENKEEYDSEEYEEDD